MQMSAIKITDYTSPWPWLNRSEKITFWNFQQEGISTLWRDFFPWEYAEVAIRE